MNIYEKLLKISGEATAVAKNLTVGVGKNTYKGVGEADVLSAIKPLEAKYGVYSYPAARQIISADVYTTKTDYGDKMSQFVRVETTYRFVNTEKPDECIDITTYGDGVDPQDKAPGKAMTYADKYALLKAYKLITGEDPDQYPSEDMTPAQRTAQKAAQKPANPVTEAQRKEMDELGMKLADVAVYYKKQPEALNEEEAAHAIRIKRESIARKKQKAGEPA